jgi:hypothetical protein
MIRVGIRFESLSASEQATLDRFLFMLLQHESRARRHLRGELYRAVRRPREQRTHHRVAAPPTVIVRCRPAENERLLEPAAQAQVVAGTAPYPVVRPLTLVDLSGTGCALLCPAGQTPEVNQAVELDLQAEDLTLHLRGVVIYAL